LVYYTSVKKDKDYLAATNRSLFAGKGGLHTE